MDGRSNKPECSVIWSQETDCLGNLQKEICSVFNYFDCLNIKPFLYLVTDTLPPQAVPLCPRRVWSYCVPGTWHIFPHPGHPLTKVVKRDRVQRSYVFCSSVTITPGLTELTRTFFGASSNATHLNTVFPGWSSDLRNAFLCSLAYLVIWSSAALEILYANTLQGRYME